MGPNPPNLAARAWRIRSFWLAVSLAALALTGLSPGPARAQASEQLLLTPDQPSGNGVLVGATGGAFMDFWLSTPGQHRSVSLRLDLAQGPGSLGDNVGFNVYRAADGAWTARGVPLGADPGARTALASLSSARPQPYLVQVFNYLPGLPLAFTLTADFSPLGGAAEPRGAPVLYAGSPPAAGRVDGLGAGSGDASSAYFLLAYPGRFEPLEVTVVFSGTAKEVPRIVSSSVAVYLWAGRKLLACAGPARRLWSRLTGPVTGTLDLFGVPVQCSPPQGRYRGPLTQDPANLYTVSEARVLRWAGGADARELGLQIVNYKASGPPGRVDYVVSAKGLRPAPEGRS